MSRIDNSLPAQTLDRLDASQAPAGNSRRPDALAASQQDSVTHSRAPELLQALNNLGQIPHVRHGLAQSEAVRLNNRELTPSDVAQQTAPAILPDPLRPAPTAT